MTEMVWFDHRDGGYTFRSREENWIVYASVATRPDGSFVGYYPIPMDISFCHFSDSLREIKKEMEATLRLRGVM